MKSTCQILSDLNEKIIAAIALKGIHNTYSALIDEAIEITLKKRNESYTGALTAQDLFYVKVTKIHELFKVFASVGDDFLNREQSTSKVSQVLLDINTIILVSVLHIPRDVFLHLSHFRIPDDASRSDEISRIESVTLCAASFEGKPIRMCTLDGCIGCGWHSRYIVAHDNGHVEAWRALDWRSGAAAAALQEFGRTRRLCAVRATCVFGKHQNNRKVQWPIAKVRIASQ